jgi:hypothetical protein
MPARRGGTQPLLQEERRVPRTPHGRLGGSDVAVLAFRRVIELILCRRLTHPTQPCTEKRRTSLARILADRAVR